MMSQFNLDSTSEQMITARVVAGLGLALFSVPLTALSLSTLKSEALINANVINMCLRVISSNLCISIGFVTLKRQKDIAYEEIVANTDRFTIATYVDQPFELTSLISRFSDTQAMSLIFIVTTVIFIILLGILSALALRRVDQPTTS
jgi:hypothetical protein